MRSRPAPSAAADGHHGPSRLAGIFAGARLVLARPALRTPMLFGLAGGVLQRCGREWRPHSPTLSAAARPPWAWSWPPMLSGRPLGRCMFSRFVSPQTRLRLMGPLAFAACGVLCLFFWRPGLAVSLLILFVSGLCGCLPVGGQRRLRERGTARTAQPSLRRSPGRDKPGSGSIHDPGGGRCAALCPGGGDRRVRRCRRFGRTGGRGQRGRRSWLATADTISAEAQPQVRSRMPVPFWRVRAGVGGSSAPGQVAHGGSLLAGAGGGRRELSPRSGRAWRFPSGGCGRGWPGFSPRSGRAWRFPSGGCGRGSAEVQPQVRSRMNLPLA